MSLNDAKVSMAITGTLRNALDLGASFSGLDWTRSVNWLDGTGLGQADMMWHDARQIAASSNDDLDLTGSLAGILSGTLAFVRVKLIAVYAKPSNTNNVVIGNHPTAAFVGPFGAAAHTEAVRPGGLHLSACSDATGWPVTATTADILRIANSAGGTVVDYEVVIIGATA